MPTVQSVKRAFAILEAVAAHPAGVGVTEIAHQVRLPKSTVSRLLSTLENVEAVERVPNQEGFQIGEGIVALASQVSYSRHLITIARPYLLELAQATGETTHLCLPDGNQAHYVDQVNSLHHIQIQDWIGSRFPLHVTSNGKVFLAYWPEEKLDQYLAQPLQRFTPQTIINPDELRQQLVQVRQQGYAWVYGEFDSEVVGLGAPIWDKSGQVVASISTGGPIYRFPPKGQADEMARLTVEACHKVSAHIGEYP